MIRYSFAGTAATVLVEGITHSLDTVNMRAKVINGPKVYVLQLIRNEGIFTLLKGF